MKISQQGIDIFDTLQKDIGPGEKPTGLAFGQGEKLAGLGIQEKAAAKAGRAAGAAQTSFSLGEVTYQKPGTEENKTVVEELEKSAALDATDRKNQMAVLAGTVSEEDYARMQEDGFSLDSTASNVIVTETDKIKAQLAEAGVDVSCFGDDLSMEQIKAITGSAGQAAQLAAAFREADLPLTEENLRESAEALRQAESLGSLDEGAKKYLLDNALSPTIGNLYMAEHCGGGSFQAQSTGTVDISSFSDQIADVIREAGLSVDGGVLKSSQWLLENGIPLTAGNLKYLDALENCALPPDTGETTKEIAAAVASGGRPKEALLLPGFDSAAAAGHAMDVVAGAAEEDLAYLIDHGMELNIRNLERAAGRMAKAGQAVMQVQSAQPEENVSMEGAAKGKDAAGTASPSGVWGRKMPMAAGEGNTVSQTVQSHAQAASLAAGEGSNVSQAAQARPQAWSAALPAENLQAQAQATIPPTGEGNTVSQAAQARSQAWSAALPAENLQAQAQATIPPTGEGNTVSQAAQARPQTLGAAMPAEAMQAQAQAAAPATGEGNAVSQAMQTLPQMSETAMHAEAMQAHSQAAAPATEEGGNASQISRIQAQAAAPATGDENAVSQAMQTHPQTLEDAMHVEAVQAHPQAAAPATGEGGNASQISRVQAQAAVPPAGGESSVFQAGQASRQMWAGAVPAGEGIAVSQAAQAIAPEAAMAAGGRTALPLPGQARPQAQASAQPAGGEGAGADAPETLKSAAAGSSGSEEWKGNGNGDAPYTQRDFALLTARRQLEETRLVMTVEANQALLKKGIAIDIEPLEKLVEKLRGSEDSYYRNLLEAQDAEPTKENIAIFRETEERVEEMKTLPAYVLGRREVEIPTINAVCEAGRGLKEAFQNANDRYEALMTAPRRDLGDSIQKAFRNVDAILEDIGLKASEANRRAVRILGYNELEITGQSVLRMKQADETVQRVFQNMTPAAVTQLIKRGVNPLDMDFESLNNTVEQIKKELGTEDAEKFSEYLWKLEKNNAISEPERSTYIGIYRLLYQVNQTDGAAVGALLEQGADITLRNLLTAVRSGRRSGSMDYAVDDSFASADGGYQGGSITDQVEAAYQANCVKNALDNLTPGRVRAVLVQVPDWEEMTPEELLDAMRQTDAKEDDLDYAYARERLAELRQGAKASQDIYEVLEKYDVPNTVSNVLAMEDMMRNRNRTYRKLFGDGVKDAHEEIGVDDLEEIKEQILEDFAESLAAPKELAEVQERLGEIAENVMKGMLVDGDVTGLDVREMRIALAQLSINRQMARQEQYSVPVLVGGEVVNVSLKIVRGVEKKGIVDIMLQSELRGKIAATLKAEQEGINAFVATDSRETKELLQESGGLLSEYLGVEEGLELHCALIPELDLNHFSMGAFGVRAEPKANEDTETEDYQIQTTRLYRMAEGFIKMVRDVL